jgi:NAD(P)-dependent dehydrogenase (short-subunit alcohol dehydrogenase family)
MSVEDELRFDGQVAVVTGGGRGLGRSYALLLASRGAKVVVNDLGAHTDGTLVGEDRAGQVVAEITAAGGTAVANRSSVATPEGGEAIIHDAVKAFGRVDIVINNAGHKGGNAFDDENADEKIDAMLKVHLRGAFSVTRPAWRLMKEQRYGRIVFTSSEAVLGIPGPSPYAAAKAGLIGLTNELALEGADLGIKVNAVLPTAKTPGNEGISNPVFSDWLRSFTPAHVAPMVAFLGHSSCPWSGEKFLVGGGRVCRLFLASTPGVFVSDPTIESFAAQVVAIEKEDGYSVSRSAMDDMKLWFPYVPWPDPEAPVTLQ